MCITSQVKIIVLPQLDDDDDATDPHLPSNIGLRALTLIADQMCRLSRTISVFIPECL